MLQETCLGKGDNWSCGREPERGEYCAFHYRQRRRGSTLKPPPGQGRTCTYPGCTRGHSAKGYCSAHYNQKFLLGYTELVPIGSYSRDAPSKIRDERGSKKCSTCAEWKAEAAFNKRVKGPDGLTTRCAECGRRASLWKSYKLTPERLSEMVESQGGCAICGVKSPPSQWHVDHDHSCCPGGTTCGGCVRGILCNNCNLGIGMLSDSPEVLEQAAVYLRQWKSVRLESGG